MQFDLYAVYFTTFILSLASATPVVRRQTANTWQVTGFDPGCSPGSCVYSFVVSGPATQSTPGFNATCQGTNVAGDYQVCSDKTVCANLIPRQSSVRSVLVKHKWSTNDEGGFSEAHGNANVTDEMTTFPVRITQRDGVS